MREQATRQSFLGLHSDETLAGSCAAIVGLGGGGSHIVQQLAHLGVGKLVLADGDRIEASNLNRLVGGTLDDVEHSRLKVDIARRLALGVNPEAKVQTIPSRWQDDYLALREADVIFGCVDSFGERLQLESAARRFLTPYIDIGMDVSSEDSGFRITGQVALSIPGKKCLRCMGLFNDDDLAKEAYGVAGGRPQVIWPNGLLASAAVGCFVKLVCPWNRNLETPLLLGFEGNTQLLQRDNRLLHNPNGVCVHFPDEQIGDPLWVPEGL